MNNHPTASPTTEVVASALYLLQSWLTAGLVELGSRWLDTGSGPGYEQSFVHVSVAGDQEGLATFLDGLTDRTGPEEWAGNHAVYRDWRGTLLTMPVLVTERLQWRITADAGPAYPGPRITPEEVEAALAKFADRPPVEPEPEPAGDPDRSPLLDLLVEERFGPVEPESREDLEERYGTFQVGRAAVVPIGPAHAAARARGRLVELLMPMQRRRDNLKGGLR